MRNPSLSVSKVRNTSLRTLESDSDSGSEGDSWSPLKLRVLESRWEGERCFEEEDEAVASSSLMTRELSTSLLCAASHLKSKCVILLLSFAFSTADAASASQAASRKVVWKHSGRVTVESVRPPCCFQ